MDDLISRKEAIDLLKQMRKDGDMVPWEGKNVFARIRELPTIQPEIVRCKDCKHWREGTAFSYCDKLYGMGVLDALDYMVAEDDFCSRAERREE